MNTQPQIGEPVTRRAPTTISESGLFRFSLRTMLAITAGFAVVAFVVGWLMNEFEVPFVYVAVWILPSVVGAFIGIWYADRHNRSTLLHAVTGGVLCSLICPCLIVIYFFAIGELIPSVGLMAFLAAAFFSGGFGLCISALLAAVIGILREGITLSRKSSRQSAAQETREEPADALQES